MLRQSNNNKLKAENTLLLYFRMLFMMEVSLYMNQVLWTALGVEYFGKYK